MKPGNRLIRQQWCQFPQQVTLLKDEVHGVIFVRLVFQAALFCAIRLTATKGKEDTPPCALCLHLNP